MLIIVYFIILFLSLTGYSLFSAIGIIAALCYLPGLVVIATFKRGDLVFEDMILSFPVSLCISSLLTLIFLYTGIQISYIAYLIYAVTGLIVLVNSITCKGVKAKVTGAEIIFIIMALLATFLFSIPIFSERIAISHHGFHHFSLVTSILNGFFPPDNPGLGGTLIGYHWGYHAFIAALSYPMNINPLRVFSILNIISLFFIFCIAYRSAKAFGLSEGFCWIVPIALFGLMRSDAVIYFANNLISGEFPPVLETASAPLNLLTSWVWGVPYLDTRLFFMNKFYNANNMPVGLCLIFAFFLIILLRQEEKAENQKRYLMANLTFVLAALAFNYAFFLIIPLIFVPVWVVILFFTSSGNFINRSRDGLELIVPCIVAAAVSAPYLWVVASGGSVLTAGEDVSSFKFFYLNVQTIKNLIVFLLPSPFILAGFWLVYKQFLFSRKSLFLFSGTLIFIILSVFLRLNWSNSAKFSFILSFFFSFPFVLSLKYISAMSLNRWLSRTMIGIIVISLLSTPLLTEAAYLRSQWFNDDTYAFQGKHLVFSRDRPRNEAYDWIRNNTSVDSLMLLPFFAMPQAPGGITIAQDFSYRPSALTERSLFVIKDVYAYVSPEFNERTIIRELLFSDPRNNRVRKYLMTVKRPVYLLEEDTYGDSLLYGVKFNRRPEHSSDIFHLVFNNDRQRVYKIHYNKDENDENLK